MQRTTEKAEETLKQGNTRFYTGNSTSPNQDLNRLQQTAKNGQLPFATVVSCSDSRVPIEIIFDQGIGDIFTIKVAGNIISTNEAGSIEYAVDHLHTPLLVVLGHYGCGACEAVFNGVEFYGNTKQVMDKISPAKEYVLKNYSSLNKEEKLTEIIKKNIWNSIEDLINLSPFTKDKIINRELKVVGALYDINNGQIQWLNEHPNQSTLLK